MRALCAMGFARETGVRKYAATAITHAMATGAVVAAHRHFFDQGASTAVTMPAYFASSIPKNQCPWYAGAGAFQFAHKTDMETFEYWNKVAPPSVIENFNTFMRGTRLAGSSWFDWFPMRERLLEGFPPEAPIDPSYPDQDVLMVDVGGNVGHDLNAFAEKVGKDMSCRLVLQDSEHVLNKAIGLDARIERMSHSFFEPNPVKGKWILPS